METYEDLRQQTSRANRRTLLRNVPSEPTFQLREAGSRLAMIHDTQLSGITKGWARQSQVRSELPAGRPTGNTDRDRRLRPLEGNASGASPPTMLPFSDSARTEGQRSPSAPPSHASMMLRRRTPGCSSYFEKPAKTSTTNLVLGNLSGVGGCRLPGTGAFGK
eukprot:TRINITY_DN63443_c0_g1_i1.p1 TRINITY_DN63443_c0_g1~~TRINITY_DN63443_c0_g1_i1.p1  ORF type:complete len:177 (+),score=5.86 TRINITY_DN63443_c0_g1_i1:44-532(+)